MIGTSSGEDHHHHVLQSLVEYDHLRRTSNSNITRIQNVDVLVQGGGVTTEREEEEIAFCHVPILSPLSRLRSGKREIEFEDEFEIIAAVMLAMEHFNTGNGTIIPDIEGINQRCNIRFTTELVDTEHSESAAVNQVINIVSRRHHPGGGGDGNDDDNNNNNKPLPCSFFGTTRSSVCIPTAIITGLKGYPQFSPECTSPQLNSENQFPLFGRLINSDDGTSLPVLKWLQQRANVDNLLVLYRDDSYGIEYARAIQHTAKEMASTSTNNDSSSSSSTIMNIELVVLPYDGVQESDFDRAIQQILETKYRFIFAIISRSLHYDTLMTKAYEAGIAGASGQYTWIFSDSLGTKLLSREFDPLSKDDDKPLIEATRGIGLITPVGGSLGTPIYNRYSTSLSELNNPIDLQYLKSKFLPILTDRQGDVDPNELQSHLDGLQLGEIPKETFSSLAYDTIIAIGQGACAASAAAAANADEEDQSSSSATSSSTYFNGAQHFQAIVNHQFQGISGTIDLDKTTGSRNPESALFNMINFVVDDDNDNGDTDPTSTTIRFRGVVTDVFDNGTWIMQEPYRFNDGSTTAPLDLPTQELDYNYIGTPLRSIGLTLSVVILLTSITFAIWTYIKRKTRVVCASQPIFLTLICAGTFLMGASIIPLSIDDQIASVEGCNIACMSSWWLLGIGFPISLSALVTKTNRIVRIVYVGSFRRVRIGAGDVMIPMVAFIGVNALILTMWTILSPLQWTRETIATDNFGRPSESYGHCHSEGSLPYAITLCVVNFGCLVAGVTQAYKARHLSTDFAESEYIAMAMALMLVVGFIAIPVVIIAEENPGAFFFVVTAVVFACSMSLLMLVFLPKMFAVTTVRGSGRRSSISDLRRTLSQPSFRRELTTSSIITPESGIACVNPDQLLPRTRRENKDLLNLTAALQNRIRHLEEENSGAAVPESAILMGDNTMRHDSSVQGGINVVDKREELKEVQKENGELRKLRRELEERLSNLEKNQPYENDV